MKSKDSKNWILPPGGEESKQMIMDYVLNRSVALLLIEGPNHISIGGSVCVKLENRNFLATAAHNLENISKPSQFRVMPRGERGFGDDAIISLGASTIHDVAYLELPEDYILSKKIEQLQISDLKLGQRHDLNTAFLICGFPCQEAIAHSNDDIEPVALSLMTSSVNVENDTDRLTLQYPPQSELDKGLELVEPFGLSGCGVWSFPPFQTNPIWSPSKSQLLGIASSWNKSKGYEIAEPMEYWLELIALEIPELRNVIGQYTLGAMP
jgi:hypothetical protein